MHFCPMVDKISYSLIRVGVALHSISDINAFECIVVVLEGGRIWNLCHELNHFHTVEYRADHK